MKRRKYRRRRKTLMVRVKAFIQTIKDGSVKTEYVQVVFGVNYVYVNFGKPSHYIARCSGPRVNKENTFEKEIENVR